MEKCFNFNFNCFLKGLFYAIIVLSVFDLSLVLYKIFTTIYTETTPAAVLSVYTKGENLMFFLTALFGLVTLYVASKQLSKHSETACINALAELRRQLTTGTNRNVHFMLSLKEDKKTLSDKDILEKDDAKLKECELKTPDNIPMTDVYNYLGTIGLGVNMVRKKLIDKDMFYNHIGYRVENIFEGKSKIHEKVRDHIKDNKFYYNNLRWMYEKIKKGRITINPTEDDE